MRAVDKVWQMEARRKEIDIRPQNARAAKSHSASQSRLLIQRQA